MSDFTPAPLLNLADNNALTAALADPDWCERLDKHKWEVRSQTVVDAITQIETEGNYPYNTTVQRLVEQRLGIPQQPDNSSLLSLLVYNSQKYQKSEKLVAEGYVPLTQELVDTAFAAKEQVLFFNGTLANPRNVDGNVFLFLPRQRIHALMMNGAAVRRVPRNKTKPIA